MKKSLPKHPVLTGAMLLTLAGILSRIIGFFYKIFLSREIGAEALGIYQLIFPVMGVCFSLTSAGIQTSISRYVSKAIGNENSKSAYAYLQTGLLISIVLSLLVGGILYSNSDFIAIRLLGEIRCTSLLRIISFSYVPCCIHACINGYYYGKKKALVPAISQLTEQIVRVGSVYLMNDILSKQGKSITLSIAVLGLVFGELAGMILSLSFLKLKLIFLPTISYGKDLLAMAIPLSATRLILSLFSSMEHILIPNRLIAFGYTTKEALSVFGILTGMALSIILLPSVLTNSVSVILLPTIAEAQAKDHHEQILSTIRKTVSACLILGFLTCFGFRILGSFLGNFIFANALSGTFIKTLSFICPFLYLSSTLTSILHGLGHPKLTFLLGICGCVVRILFIYFGIPFMGISGYMYGLIASYIFQAGLALMILERVVR